MRILSMTAVFGKLDGETLTLRGGLNVICAPNEWGKSTWCAFLTAMLYGIDTRERTTRSQMAEKERYQPWSGRPMEGRLRLLWQGRDITIERRSTGRTPLGDFRAYETETGIPVPELTAESCGQTLLGVEKRVFRSSGFLRLTELSAPADESLRSRLAALVTTGDDSGSAELLGTRLRELKNRCRYNRTGLIPECSRQIQALQSQAAERAALDERMQNLQTRLHEDSRRLEQLETHRAFLDYAQSQADAKRLEDAHQEEADAWNEASGLEKVCAGHPPKQVLAQRIERAQALLEDMDDIEGELGPLSSVFLWIAALLCGAGAFFCLTNAHWGIGAPLAALAVLFAVLAVKARRRAHQARIQRRSELAKLSGRRTELRESLSQWQRQLQELDALEQARKSLKTARSHREALQSMARTADEPAGEDPLALPREETEAEIEALSRALRQSRTELAQCAGRAEAFPEAGTLRRKLEQQRQRLAELQQYYRALELALSAHEAASASLQRRFAPRITRRAEEYLAFLTGGAYDRISIDENLAIHAARSEETALRSARSRSDGTGDLLYLALRLAVWQELSDSAPLILDDALARLDQNRLEKAMELLAQLADTRQIVLFSCQTREREWMDR